MSLAHGTRNAGSFETEKMGERDIGMKFRWRARGVPGASVQYVVRNKPERLMKHGRSTLVGGEKRII